MYAFCHVNKFKKIAYDLFSDLPRRTSITNTVKRDFFILEDNYNSRIIKPNSRDFARAIKVYS